MGNTKLDETYILLISIKIRSFNVSIGIKIMSFRVSVTIEPGFSVLTVRFHELFEMQPTSSRITKLILNLNNRIAYIYSFSALFQLLPKGHNQWSRSRKI